MAAYAPPLRDLEFLLHDVLRVSETPIPGYDELDRATTGAILEEAGRIASEALAPLNAVGDRDRLRAGERRRPHARRVSRPPSTPCATAAGSASTSTPSMAARACRYMLQHRGRRDAVAAANMALNMYWGLTHGAYDAIVQHGSAEQKATYLPKLVSGEWTGTMNLTEPHSGTDLGLLRTRAEPQTGRQLPGHRPEDLHLRRRARPHREHRPSGRWRRSPAVPRGSRASASSSCRSSSCTTTARSARATRSPAASSRRRWASTATRPA